MSTLLPADYLERTYAGVLGKIIGVYLGRPFEGRAYREILRTQGPINFYVHERCNAPLIVTDDDISGTFTFIRALEDSGVSEELSARDLGRMWLNYIIENKTILWWGGMGMSTEHTAYLRLKQGIEAPASGSIALNSKVVAEQIGAQIFIDGWGMVAPGRPAVAAKLAARAGSVSHDGEAVWAAQAVAAMVAAAYVERDIGKLLDVAVGVIPPDSVLRRMIDELRDFRVREGDWNKAMTDVMEKSYGYDKYGGNCHVIPNHGLIILALLWGDDDFQKSLMIANTCGWDTDCNSGNVGAILGVKNGLAGIDAGPDFRGPVADRLLLPTAEGGSAVTDAVTQAVYIANLGRRLAGAAPERVGDGARFHFSLPGSVQGFVGENARLANPRGQGLEIHYAHLATAITARAATATFATPEYLKLGGYSLVACPTVYPGQTVSATLSAGAGNGAAVNVGLFLRHYGEKETTVTVAGPTASLRPGESATLRWPVPATGGQPIYEIGVELTGERGASGHVTLSRLDWTGEPSFDVVRIADSDRWKRAWVAGVDQLQDWGRTDESQALVVINNVGRGIATLGTRQWRDYRVGATLRPHLARAFGLAIRAQGLRRWYGLVIGPGKTARLVKCLHDDTTLAEAPVEWALNHDVAVTLSAKGDRLRATVGDVVLEARDSTFDGGAMGLIIDEGRCAAGPIEIRPA